MTTASSAAGVPAAGERKFAVMLFADLTGYTTLCRRLDPEDVVATVHPVMASLRRAAQAEGGVICSTAGDGFFAVFGVPITFEDAATRAVRSADAMRRLVREANAQPRAIPFPEVHIGIAAGEVLVVPSDEPTGWSLVGSAVNLASRLCDAAGPSEVLVDSQCRELVASAATWDPPRRLSLRGHDDTVAAFSVSAATSTGTATAQGTPFIDRLDLLRRLDAELESVVALAVARVVHVTGEPGIGKTRLLSHWLEQHDDVAALWLRCGASGIGNQLLELVDLVSGHVGDDAGDVRAALSAYDEAGGSVASRTDPFPAVRAECRRLFEQAGAQGPLVVVVDDVHAADPGLAGLLSDLRERPVAGSTLIVATSRSDDAVTLGAADLHVPRLVDSDVEKLLAAALGGSTPARVRAAVVERVAGHPLMVVQSAAYLIESGAVEVDERGSRLVAADAPDVLPTSLRLFVSARIDRLPAAEKSLLQEISTCGDEIDATALAAVADRSPMTALAELARRGLVVQVGDTTWRFAHGLVQEVAYSSLPRARRADLHRRQLAALDQASPSARAFHALSWARSASAGDLADARTGACAAIHETLHHAQSLFRMQADAAYAAAQRALPFVDDRGDDVPVDAARLLTLAANCLIEMWRFDEATQAAGRAVDICRRNGVDGQPLVDAMLANGHALSRLRRYQAARQVLDEANGLAEASRDDVRRGRSLRLLGDTWRHASYARFMSLTEEAFAVLDSAGDEEGAAECARILAYLTSYSPASMHDRWCVAARSRTSEDDLRGQAWLARAAAMAANVRREFAAARQHAKRAVELGEALASLDVLADGLSVLAAATTATGDLDTFTATSERFMALAADSANPRTTMVAAQESALGLLRAGRLEDALEALDAARDAASGLGADGAGAVAVARADLSRDRGAWWDAMSALTDARQANADVPFDVEALVLRTHELRIAVAMGARPSLGAFASLEADCRDAGAPRVASYVDAIAEQARVLSGEPTELVPADPHTDPEERAIRADTAALAVELAGADATASWRAAAQAWSVIGETIWLARALARAGDIDAAERTLTAIGADEEARAWALQR